jgi:hypothetical protein
VEVPGFEPGSMIPDQGVSTCLFYLLSFRESSGKRDLFAGDLLILLIARRHHNKSACIIKLHSIRQALIKEPCQP